MKKAALLRSPLVAGSLWSLSSADAFKRLGVSSATLSPNLTSEWFLQAGFHKLWGISASSTTNAGFQSAPAASGVWLLFRQGLLFGYVQKVPLDDWDAYEAPARKVFGSPEKIHHFVSPLVGKEGPARFLHIYQWKGRRTWFHFVKATWEDDSAQWLDRQGDARWLVGIMQRAGDLTIPLFMVAVDAKAVADLSKHKRSDRIIGVAD